MEMKKRIASFELLRIIAMLMVVMLHYISHTGSLAMPDMPMTPVRAAGGLLEALCIPAVNVYVLISGYFSVDAAAGMDQAAGQDGRYLSRICRLVLQVLFYSAAIPLILKLAGQPVQGSSLWSAAVYLLPFSMEHYWFATAFLVAMAFSPLLLYGAAHASQKQLRSTIAAVLLFFSLIKSFSPVQLVTDRYGYSFGWFLCLYLVGAYIRLYGIRILDTRAKAALCYFASSAGTFALHYLLHMLSERTGRLAYYASVPLHYNALLCLTGAVGLVCWFRDLKVPEGKAADWIRTISGCTFGIYLLHEHIDIRERWSVWTQMLTGPVRQDDPAGFVIRAVFSSVLVFAAGMAADLLRQRLFTGLRRHIR